MIFINTRPNSRAKPLTDFLQAQSITVIELPLLELIAKPLTAAEQTALNNISQANAIILVSEEAVNYGLTTLNQKVCLSTIAQLPITWLAVGEKTADCFFHTWQNLSNAQPPTVIFPTQKSEQNNEGLLNLSQIQSLKQGDKIQIWRGVGGRELLANALLAKGIQVDLINFYQRILPNATIEKFADLQHQLSANDKKVVLISSLTAWQHWQQLVANSPLTIQNFDYQVLQHRIANVIRQEHSGIRLTMIDDLEPTTIYQTING